MEYEIMKQKMLESFAKFQNKGSGWSLDNIEELEIFITKYKPMRGKPLPNEIKARKATINPENDDDKCFIYSVTLGCEKPWEKGFRNPQRITEVLKKQAEKKYNDFKGLEFPVQVKNIHIFEKKNNVSVHVLSYCDDTKKVYPLTLW